MIQRGQYAYCFFLDWWEEVRTIHHWSQSKIWELLHQECTALVDEDDNSSEVVVFFELRWRTLNKFFVLLFFMSVTMNVRPDVLKLCFIVFLFVSWRPVPTTRKRRRMLWLQNWTRRKLWLNPTAGISPFFKAKPVDAYFGYLNGRILVLVGKLLVKMGKSDGSWSTGW
jgi:hypothetical protein